MFEGREIASFAKLEFLLEIAGEVVMPGELNRGREGRVGLNEDFPRCFAPAGPTSDLGEQLKGAFACPEVRQVEREIGVDDSDERDVGEMEALRDHLRTDQDVDLAGAKS